MFAPMSPETRSFHLPPVPACSLDVAYSLWRTLQKEPTSAVVTYSSPPMEFSSATRAFLAGVSFAATSTTETACSETARVKSLELPASEAMARATDESAASPA